MIGFRGTPRESLLTAVAVFVMYVLSVGPVVWLFCNVRLPHWLAAGFAAIYSAFDDLVPSRWSSLIGGCLRAYAGLWGDLSQPMTTPPSQPLPFLRECLEISIAAWLIWNVVGWFNHDVRPCVTTESDGSPGAAPAHP